ncbi:MAG: LPS assembly protein LptD [Pseudomonadota bacterium]
MSETPSVYPGIVARRIACPRRLGVPGKMSGETRLLRLAGLMCVFAGIVFASPVKVLAQSEDERKAYVCLPTADGEGWDCARGREQPSRQQRSLSEESAVVQKEPVPSRSVNDPGSVRETDPEATQPAPVTLSPGIAERELSWGETPRGIDSEAIELAQVDPETLFVPTTPRPAQSSHELTSDLADRIYVRQADSTGNCSGRYQTRNWQYPLSADDATYPLIAEADSLSHQLDGQSNLSGNVTIEQGNRVIVAQEVQLSEVDRVATFPTGVRMDQPGLSMQGGDATLELNTKQAELVDAQFVLTDVGIRGVARNLQQSESGDLVLQESQFTRCEPQNNGWVLSTDSLLIEEDEVFGTARGAVLRLKSVPVFYSPYLKFPVSDERVSGFLFPNIGYSDEDGLDLSVPYYLNLAPNYDATIVPRYISDRGAGAEAEFRYKSSWQETTFSGALLPEDDLYNGTLDRDDFDDLGGEPVLGDFDPADRWLGGIHHEGGIGSRVRTFVDYTAVSDRDYFRDLGSDLSVSSRIELQRKAEVQYTHNGLFARVWAQRFQRLDEIARNEYERLPEFEMLYANSLGPVEFSLGAKWADFDRETDGLVNLEAVTGTRTHVEPRLRLPFSWPFGFLSFGAGYRYTSYDLDQDLASGGVLLDELQPDRNIGTANVDGGLIFERELEWFNTPMIQTLEPRIYYLWQEFDDQSQLPRFDASELTFGYNQLFRGNRFSGLDRIGDADQLSTGVTTRFLGRDTGREYFRFSLGEIFYFKDRRVTLSGGPGEDEMQNSSAIASEMSAAIARNWRIRGTLVWDPHDNEVDEGGAAVQYVGDNRHIFNVGFRNRRDQDIEQTDISVYWPISDRFSIMGRWNYDLVSGRTIEGFGGIEYSDCCLQVRLLARRFLDAPTVQQISTVEPDDGIFLQIVFKGLAGFGTKVESVLERGIRGYRSPEPNSYFSN